MGVAAAVSFGRQVTLAALLEPETFGRLSIVALGAAYYSYLWTLGTHEALLKVTTSASAGDARRRTGDALVFTTVAFLIVTALWTSGVALAVDREAVKYLLLAVPLYSFARAFSALSMVGYRAKRKHSLFGRVLAVRNTLSMFGSAGGAYLFPSVLAPLAGDAVAYVAVGVRSLCEPGSLGLRHVRERFRRGWGLVAVGLPYSLMALLRNIGLNLDNWSVLLFRSSRELGLYSLTMVLLALGGVLNNVIAVRLQPELLARVAQGENPRELFRLTARYAGLILLALLTLTVPATFIMQFGISRFLPLYGEIGSLLIGWTLLGIAFEVANIFDAASLPFDVAYRGTLVYASSAILVGIGSLTCGLLGMPLWSFALVFAVGRLANFVGNYVVIRSKLAIA